MMIIGSTMRLKRQKDKLELEHRMQHPCVCEYGRKRKPLTKKQRCENARYYLCPKQEEKSTTTQEPDYCRRKKKETKTPDEVPVVPKQVEYERRNIREMCACRDVPNTNYKFCYRLDFEDAFNDRKGSIDWKKPPLIEVKPTKTSEFRKKNPRVCGIRKYFGKRKRRIARRPIPPPPTGACSVGSVKSTCKSRKRKGGKK